MLARFFEDSILRLAAFQAPDRRRIEEANPPDLSVSAYTPPEPDGTSRGCDPLIIPRGWGLSPPCYVDCAPAPPWAAALGRGRNESRTAKKPEISGFFAVLKNFRDSSGDFKGCQSKAMIELLDEILEILGLPV